MFGLFIFPKEKCVIGKRSERLDWIISISCKPQESFSYELMLLSKL